MPGAHNEHKLILLIASGDEQAFRKIFDHYRDKLYTYALRLTRDQELAEDIVLDVFLKIWINRAELPRVIRFDYYLQAIVRNRTFNSLKRIAHEADILKELSLSSTEYEYTTEETVIYNDYRSLLHQAVDRLPPQQKQVYILSRNAGLKYHEIASELNLSKNTVKAHLKKATSTLRAIFINYMIFIAIIIFQ